MMESNVFQMITNVVLSIVVNITFWCNVIHDKNKNEFKKFKTKALINIGYELRFYHFSVKI